MAPVYEDSSKGINEMLMRQVGESGVAGLDKLYKSDVRLFQQPRRRAFSCSHVWLHHTMSIRLTLVIACVGLGLQKGKGDLKLALKQSLGLSDQVIMNEMARILPELIMCHLIVAGKLL